MPDTFVRTRCVTCSRPLGFDDWSRGSDRCLSCSATSRPAQYVAGPMAPAPARTGYAGVAAQAEAYERLLDDIPDELIDELVAALEAEAARLESAPLNPVREVIAELAIGNSPREIHWAAWGFAAGFAANVALAKYAQMSAGAPMSRLILPMLIGGVVAGATCAAIGWGLARLRQPGP